MPKPKKTPIADAPDPAPDPAPNPGTDGVGSPPSYELPRWAHMPVTTQRRESKDGAEWDVTVTEYWNEHGSKVVLEERVQVVESSAAKSAAQHRGELVAEILNAIPAWLPAKSFVGMQKMAPFEASAECVFLAGDRMDVVAELEWCSKLYDAVEALNGDTSRDVNREGESMFGEHHIGKDGAEWASKVLSIGSLATRSTAADIAAQGPLDALRTNTLTWIGDRISWHARRLLLHEILKATGWNLALAAGGLRASGSGTIVRLIRDLDLSAEYEAARAGGAGRPGPKPKT